MNKASLLFVPCITMLVLSMTYFFLNVLNLSYPYLFNLFFLISLLSFFEYVIPKFFFSHESSFILRDLFFIFLNPLLIPLVWFLVTSKMIHIPSFSFEILGQMPFSLLVVFIYIVGEFFRYWVHRLQHQVPFLWKYHAVHHCMKEIKVINSFISHPLDYFLRGILPFTPFLFFNIPIEALIYARTLSMVFSILSHANLSIDNGFWNLIFPTYQVHRWHHSFNPRLANNNYGIGTLLWDHCFNSYFFPKKDKDSKFGILDSAYNDREISSLLWIEK